jgi:hypothetical protein
MRSINVQVEQGSSFMVVLTRSNYEDDQWALLVGSLRVRGLLDFLRGRNPIGVSPEWIQVCRDIHTMLTSSPGITDVRWYFEGFRSQSAAVATPDELPWGEA